MNQRPEFDVLPRGRHRLSREEVRNSQRARLLVGMAEVVSEKGYVRTSVADVLKRVRISRETFYQNFADKQECFLAVLDQSSVLLATLLTGRLAGMSEPEPVLDRLERVLASYFETLAEQSAIARVFFLESYVAGPAAQRKRYEVSERFTDLVQSMLEAVPQWQRVPDSRFACRLVVGGISSMVAGALIADQADQLPSFTPKVMALIRQLVS